MSTRILSLRPMFEDLGLPADFENTEISLLRWSRELAPGHMTVAVIDISEEGENEYLLTFNRYEIRNGARETDMILFDAAYVPGQDTISVADEDGSDPDDLYEAFRADLTVADLEVPA